MQHQDRFLRAAARAVVCLLSSTFIIGCATAPETFGTRARFSPAFAGYVMAPESGSDDPQLGDSVLLLRDPLTGDKLRCREDVVEWREVHEDLATDSVHDENVAVAVGVSTGLVFGPLVATEPLGALLMAEAMLTAGVLYDDFSSDNGFELLAGGIVLYQRKRYVQAAMLIERALTKDASVGILDKAYLYLGLSYVELGRNERAKIALTMFVDRAAVRDVDAYREAEAVLKKLGVERRTCGSSGPVQLYW
jgi:tetratricopeptide (TPR) repeat protein